MNTVEANAILRAVTAWASKRDDIRALALVGSWARGNPRPTSDIDLLLLTDRAERKCHAEEWLIEIDFQAAGFRVQSSDCAVYGAVWSRHIHLTPTAQVELTFAERSWARTDPIDAGTCHVVRDAFQVMVDKDGTLIKLVDAVLSYTEQVRVDKDHR